MNLLERSLQIHRERLLTAAGGPGIYCRASYRIPVEVVIGSSTLVDETADADSYAEIKSVDFLLTPSELVLGEDSLEPQRGDRIEWRGEVYSVMAGANGAAWSWSDSRRVFYRVHTVRTEGSDVASV